MDGTSAFENDVFISYCHTDNQSDFEGLEGWINEFHSVLEKRLNKILRRDSKIWRDAKLRKSDVFATSTERSARAEKRIGWPRLFF